MPHTCTAKRRTRTKGPLAGSRDSFPDPNILFTDRACWRQLAKDAEILEYDKRGITVTDKIYFPADPKVNEKHILEVTDPARGITETLKVRSRALPDASAGMGVVWRVMAEISTTGKTG